MLWFKRPKSVITLSGGVEFDITNPDPEKINIYDVSMALSNICRFNGQIEEFYSVAEHSINVANCLEKFGHDKKIILSGLLHDAAEGYCGDIVTPLKKYLGKRYKNVEHNLELAICKKFNVDLFTNKIIIKYFDTHMFKIEYDYLKNGVRHDIIKCLPPKEARVQFREKFEELSNG